METDDDDDEDREAPKEESLGPSKPSKYLVDHQEEAKGNNEPMYLIIVPEIKKMPTCHRATLQEAEGDATSRGTIKESKRPKSYFGYATLMTHIIV